MTPSALVTVLASGSTSSMSATLTVTLLCLRKIARSGRATSVVFTCAEAIWYSSGWNWL